jgi:predicted phosphodiesterase
MPPVETVVCAGDVVGYNPMPGKCLERVRSVASTVVQGNHDRAVDSPQKYLGNPAVRAGSEYAQTQLSDQQHSWLQTQPQTATVGDGEYLLVYSHPDPDRRGDYVFPDDAADLQPFFDEYSGVIYGHTHIQYERAVDSQRVINPGSVGQPRERPERGSDERILVVIDHSEGSLIDARERSIRVQTPRRGPVVVEDGIELSGPLVTSDCSVTLPDRSDGSIDEFVEILRFRSNKAT